MGHQIVWFDMYVVDLDRAVTFYSAVLGQELKKESNMEMEMCVLPHSQGDVAGCLVKSDTNGPSSSGTLVYFNTDGRLDDAIQQVEKNGGKIIKEKHQIGPYGFCAIINDSEGNRVALHSN